MRESELEFREEGVSLYIRNNCILVDDLVPVMTFLLPRDYSDEKSILLDTEEVYRENETQTWFTSPWL